MSATKATILLAAMLCARATADISTLPELSLTQGSYDTWNASWEGEDHQAYFLQWSWDLENWYYAPVIEFGTGSKDWGLYASTDKFFARLHCVEDETLSNLQDAQNADFDNDGLSNQAEIEIHGTNPLVADTDGDGIDDGLEVNFYKTNPNSNDSDGDGIPDAADTVLVGRTASISKTKIGVQDFLPSVAPFSYYLVKLTTWTALQGATGENGEINGVGPGSSTITFARPSGEHTDEESGEGFYSTNGGTVESDTKMTKEITITSYDDPPNLGEDEPGTVDVTTILSSEYTTDMLKADAVAVMPAFSPDWTENVFASQNLSETESQYELGKLEYKFTLGPQNLESDIRWLEIFTPYDKLSTPSVDESQDKTVKVKQWKGIAAETPTYSINPNVDAPTSYGYWSVEPFFIKADQTADAPGGSPRKYSDSPHRGSASNLLSVWPDEAITLRVDLPPTLTSDNLPDNFIVWNAPGHTIAANELAPEFSWPFQFTPTAIIVVKVTIGGIEFPIHIKIQNPGPISEGEAAIYLPHTAFVMGAYHWEAIDYGNTFSLQSHNNAMRHSYWCSLAASTTGVTAGDVTIYSIAHEYSDYYSDHEQAFSSTIDIKNNNIGIATNRTDAAGLPDKPAIQQELLSRFTNGDMYIWEVPPGAVDPSHQNSEGIILKSDGYRIYP